MKSTRLKFLTILFSFGLFFAADAQQDPHYTHWRFNKLSYNPAFAGYGNKHCVSAVARRMWLSFNDESALYNTESIKPTNELTRGIGPETNTITYGGILYGFDKRGDDGIKDHSINGMFMYSGDNIAYEKNTYLKIGLAGNYEFSSGSSIRVGANYTSLSKALNGTKLRAHDPNDPLIPSANVSQSVGTVDVGLYYTNPNLNDLWVGLSSTHLNTAQFTFASFNVTTARHAYLMAGMKFNDFLGNPLLTFDPAVLVKTGIRNSPVTPQVDLNAMVTYNNMFSGGLNLRGQLTGMDATCIMLGYYPPLTNMGINNSSGAGTTLRVGYSYDITMNRVRKVSDGSHEIQINVCFPITIPVAPIRKKHNTIYLNPNPELKAQNPKNL